VQTRQPQRQRETIGQLNLAGGDQSRGVSRSCNDGPSGAPRSRVDAQDPPGVRQDAASETASASKERFA
jgi:hypothetical protein